MNQTRFCADSLPETKDIMGTALAAAAALFFLVHAGCKPRTLDTKTNGSDDRPTAESLDAARESLMQQPDAHACRAAVQQLNTHLDRFPEEKAEALPAKVDELLTQRLGLDADELAELHSSTFTLLDGHYLEQCFLLRDAARGLHVTGPASEQAAFAFGWVMRQVRLREHNDLPAPPQFVLRRGWGSAFERDLVFLRLLQQLDLQGGLLACDQGRFLSVLVDGDNLYLFDSKLGLPIPGKKGVATLAQVLKDPEVLEALTIDPKFPYDLKVERLASATLYPANTLSALAPRMRFLEEKLQDDNRVKLRVDGAAWLAQLDKVAKNHDLKPGAWPSGSARAPVRVLRAFLPPQEGGIDKPRDLPFRDLEGFATARANFKYQLYRLAQLELEQVPWTYLPNVVREQPANLEQLGMRPRRTYQGIYLNWTAPPRKLILRGRFDEASPLLVTAREQVAALRDAANDPKLPGQMQNWLDQARALQSEILNAGNEQAAKEAGERFDTLWKDSSKLLMTFLGQAAGIPADSELVYLLALCKHEQAAQIEARQGKKQAAAAWKTALDWWETYAAHDRHPAQPHARRLHAQALMACGQPERAAALLNTRDAAGLEMTGRLLLAR